jgi:hypothetical protein
MAEQHSVTLGIGADVSAVRMTALGRGYDGKAYRDLPIRDVRVSATDEDAEDAHHWTQKAFA